mgnify:FL=1
MKSIQTKYLGPTTFRGSRIKAYAEGGAAITVSYDYENNEIAHDRAARALAEKMDWSGTYVRGGAADGRGNVYVNVGNNVGPNVRGGSFAFQVKGAAR